ncbi:hypothetical protein BDN72DRAFT_116402 [Pluteus cervinus]|uniref:Uncharacterized protein n=1 Tax=Pluteus cervinus TaxID=181527 RepID=A0ACD3AMX6_9AGAR|nr:hypothetical protein BDN72DRAFT_116402 [Pluteus cervinus]
MLIILLIALTFARVRAAPFSEAGPATNPTLAHTIFFGIQPRNAGAEANTRTLYDIVRSCAFTIAACVYRAIHQNIPDPNATMWGRLRVRMKITFYALIAPEMMIWWAMRQRYGAIDIAKQVNGLNKGLKWTQTHGQFTQMGGFARKDNKQVLYPLTLVDLLKKGQLNLEQLTLTKEDIDDKSKGDILSKALVAFQTTWFVFECLARLQQTLPLIELEVVTLAFAVLNITTYALWWYKPLNALRPIYLHVALGVAEVSTPSDPSSDLTAITGTLESDQEGRPLMSGEAGILQESTAEGREAREGRGVLGRVQGAIGRMMDVMDAIKEDVGKRPLTSTIWKRLIKQPFVTVAMPLWEMSFDRGVHDEATHVPTFYGMDIPDEKRILVVRLSCFVGMVFGAIHVLSWDSSFPTRAELVLWRTSSIVLVAQPGFLLLSTMGRTFEEFFLILSIFVGPIPYILARFCLLTLAFLTLNRLPPRALDSIPWTFYIPHL